MASIAQYGDHVHDPNTVNLVSFSKSRRYSPRNKMLFEVRDIHIQGELIGTQAAIIAATVELETAYAQDGKDFTYKVGGTTVHQLLNGDDCVSKVQVVHQAYPKGTGEQFASTRTFAFVLRGIYQLPSADDVVAFEETVEVTGTGGTLWTVVNQVAGIQTTGGPVAYLLAPASAQTVVQSGYAIGLTTWPTPPAAIGVDPASGTPGIWEFGFRRRIRKTSGRQQGNGLRLWRTAWTYTFANDPRLSTTPTTPSSQ